MSPNQSNLNVRNAGTPLSPVSSTDNSSTPLNFSDGADVLVLDGLTVPSELIFLVEEGLNRISRTSIVGYDQFMRLDWGFLKHKVPIDTVTKVKVYLTAPIYDEKTLQGISWQVNPPSTFAHLMERAGGLVCLLQSNNVTILGN